MNQTILVYIIIAAVLLYSVYAVIKSLKKKDTSGCGDCHGCDLKNEINSHLPDHKRKDPTSCGCSPV
ncbi:MAG: hypothetical protein RIS29_906 [Bacteroidota bacterium]|jgi:hypothetical protein